MGKSKFKASPGKKLFETLPQSTSWVWQNKPVVPATQEAEVQGLQSRLAWAKTTRVLCSFFNQVICFLDLSCLSSLNILDFDPLSDGWFANAFSHSVCHLLSLLIISYAVFSLIQSHFFIFALCFRIISKNLLPDQSGVSSPLCSSTSLRFYV